MRDSDGSEKNENPVHEIFPMFPCLRVKINKNGSQKYEKKRKWKRFGSLTVFGFLLFPHHYHCVFESPIRPMPYLFNK